MLYAKNKKAYFDYEILDDYEAGIVLSGEEVKSIKLGRAQLKGAYIEVSANGEAFLKDAHISPYEHSNNPKYEPTAKRKLLLKKREIETLDSKLAEKGLTAVPLELYSKQGLIKLKFGLCRGKKTFDKRDTLKRRDQERQIHQQMKNY